MLIVENSVDFQKAPVRLLCWLLDYGEELHPNSHCCFGRAGMWEQT